MVGRTKGFDNVTAQRSQNMAAIRGKNTKPEMIIRRLLRLIGYPGYRLHRRDLPGKPDIAFIGRKKAVLGSVDKVIDVGSHI
ncbi:DNA mismatch endonuclease Vsr [mine drainage metagenome]|uniref:DNA mismatch endonuclease Vsr n=1 Tax=mine drainage metagenome TaxID=410659 RepID=A0A1J5PXW2_9ZZZZ